MHHKLLLQRYIKTANCRAFASVCIRKMSIKDFYSEKSVFLTGTTGFLGKLFLFKLLQLGNVSEILVLCRPRKNKSNAERLDQISNGFLFENLKESFKSKVRIINGDLQVDGLGLSSDDIEYMKRKVQIVIHAAATIRFDEELLKVIKINIRGTKSMLDLANQMENLQSFIYISTAYSNCPRKTIKEVFYEPPIGYELALELLKLDGNCLNALTDRFVAPWPNTYTFSKAIIEDMIRREYAELPIAIVRPSVVSSTRRDPVGGFSDSLYTVMGQGVGIMAGILRVLYWDKNDSTDAIPVDVVVNTTLVIAAKVHEWNAKVPPIYNMVSNVFLPSGNLKVNHLISKLYNVFL